MTSRIRWEIEALQQVRHPGIVRLLDHGSADGLTYYTMNLLRRETWQQYQGRIWDTPEDPSAATPPAANGKLEEVLRLALGLTNTLFYLHGLGFVHCDLSDSLFVDDGRLFCVQQLP